MVVVTGEDLGVCPLLHTCTTATAQFLAGGRHTNNLFLRDYQSSLLFCCNGTLIAIHQIHHFLFASFQKILRFIALNFVGGLNHERLCS